MSKLIEIFGDYLRAPQRNIVNIVVMSEADRQAMNFGEIPALVKSVNNEPATTSNPISILQEISKGAYLEDVMFGKKDSKERYEIESFIELACRLDTEELVEHINKHLAMRMFIVGQNITAADIIVHLNVAEHFKELIDFQKMELPHAFRWLDHIQHLPGMVEIVGSLGLFVSFPNENAPEPSKAQLKKLAKAQYAKEQKAAKAGGAQPAQKEESKKQQKTEGGAQQAGKAAKPKQQQNNKGGKPAAAAKGDPKLPDLSKMDIRVGKIVEAWPNPNSDKLYNEKIDMGNGEIRTIASGLRHHVTLEDMQGAMVVVLTNLKPRKIAEYESQGMVLCAQTADKEKVEFLSPPEGAAPGDLISFEGYAREPLAVLPAKKNPWDNVLPRLVTDANLVGCYKDENGKNIPFATKGGVCKASTVKDGVIG